MALQTLSPLSAADTWILEEQWSDPGQAVKMGLCFLCCSVLVYWQQNKNRSCLDTRTPEKNNACQNFAWWGHIYIFLVDKPVSKSPGVPPAGVLGMRDRCGSALGLDPWWRALGRLSPAVGKASPTASPVRWRSDVYLKTVLAAVQLLGIFVKLVFLYAVWNGLE